MLGEGFPIVKIPGHLVKAARTVMGTPGHKQTDPHSGPIGYIAVFDLSIIHVSTPILYPLAFLPIRENHPKLIGQRIPAVSTTRK